MKLKKKEIIILKNWKSNLVIMILKQSLMKPKIIYIRDIILIMLLHYGKIINYFLNFILFNVVNLLVSFFNWDYF